jgi:hypothetical protein
MRTYLKVAKTAPPATELARLDLVLECRGCGVETPIRELIDRKEMRSIDSLNTHLVIQAVGRFNMEHSEHDE